ncbi:UNVERIFIED_CONTAM: hypothetical protein GTU68_003383 [Idotea baltica]|nr:hypothetical protein [Idotea baltica]
MKAYMMEAPLGDDVLRSDPTVQRLEEMAARMFGHEAAIFCPSGTMTNQIAINVHTDPLDEVICDSYSHIYQYETAGYSFHSGVGIQLIDAPNHKLTGDLIRAAKRPVYDWLPISKLVVLENTSNKAGGTYYDYSEMQEVSAACRETDLLIHLDGARIFNAMVETGDKPDQVGPLFDSISVCLSKGLGAPIGSLLIGNREFIRKAFRVRKVMGGSMRQVGIIAAAGIYALEHHIDRLKVDHAHARQVADILVDCNYVNSIKPVQTNIVIFEIADPFPASLIVDELAQRDIHAMALGSQVVRLVFHMDITSEMIPVIIDALRAISSRL